MCTFPLIVLAVPTTLQLLLIPVHIMSPLYSMIWVKAFFSVILIPSRFQDPPLGRRSADRRLLREYLCEIPAGVMGYTHQFLAYISPLLTDTNSVICKIKRREYI